MNKYKYTAIISILLVIFTVSAIATERTINPSMPMDFVYAEMFKDGGTLQFVFLDHNQNRCTIFIDGRINSITPGALFVDTYPNDSLDGLITEHSNLAILFYDALTKWLNTHYSKQRQKELPTLAPDRLTEDDFQARWILRILDIRKTSNFKKLQATEPYGGSANAPPPVN